MILTVDDVVAHLRLDEDTLDETEIAYITNKIQEAQEAAEEYCRTSFEPIAEEKDEDGNVIKEGYTPPKAVRLAVLLLVSHFYEFRDGNDNVAYNTTMRAFKNLLYPHRDPEQMF